MKRTFSVIGAVLALTGCLSQRSDLSAPASWKSLEGDPVVVVRGDSVLPVVTDDVPEDRWAAMFLAGTIAETCGKRPDVFVVTKGQTNTIAKGLFLTRGTDGTDAFRVVAKDGSVRFGGRADFAVFDWCERELGMRYYCEGGKCVEKRDEIIVRPADYSDRPVFAHRKIGGKSVWARVAKAGSTHRGGVHVHAPHGWYRDAALKAAHPEIFETGRTPMLCYGNPETLAYYKERIARAIAGRGDSGGIVDVKRKVVTVCQWDAPVRCDCRWCRTLYAYAGGKSGFASPVLWGHFTAKLAEWLKTAHPDYMISFLPYLNTVGVPANCLDSETLRRCGNTEAEVCTMPGLAQLKEVACREREEGILRGWREATGNRIINWHYGCWPLEWTSAPYVFGRTIQRHYDDLREVTDGSFVCGGEGDPRIALSMYVWAKCLWNPDVDVEAIYDGFARRMFGAGAGPMRELIALQESCWERPWTECGCTYHNVFEVSYPPADAARMKALLREAYRRTREAGDAVSAARVQQYAAAMMKFFTESAALERMPENDEMAAGEKREMVDAREVDVKPWTKTTVDFATADGVLTFTVRCEDPAAAKMDFTTIDDDFVWGDDCVTFVLEGLGETKVYKNDRNRVTHDATGWTVTLSVVIPEEAERRGFLRGNVCRWRVGDRRMPAKDRVPGSRYVHSRLSTRYTQSDDDPSAFVVFRLR